VKIRTLIAQCAAIGAITAGGLTLTTGTAQAAIDCGYVSSLISSARATYYNDLALMGIYRDIGDWDMYDRLSADVDDDLVVLTSYRNQFRAAHCA
jgi:hypothetical protein